MKHPKSLVKISIIGFATTIIVLLIVSNFQVFPVIASQVNTGQLNEAKEVLQKQLRKLEQKGNSEIEKQRVKSKLICIKGILAEDYQIKNQTVCRNLLQEIADGKLQKPIGQKIFEGLGIIFVVILVIIGILSSIKM